MIVPGSVHNIDHPYSWYALVRHKVTGKERTYWFNGTQATKEQVANYIRDFFPNVEPVTIYQSAVMPGRLLVPVPPEDFERGAKKIAMEELGGADIDEGLVLPEPIQQRPLSRPALPRHSLVRR